MWKIMLNNANINIFYVDGLHSDGRYDLKGTPPISYTQSPCFLWGPLTCAKSGDVRASPDIKLALDYPLVVGCSTGQTLCH